MGWCGTRRASYQGYRAARADDGRIGLGRGALRKIDSYEALIMSKRQTRRTFGCLQGHADALLPCIYLADYGVSRRSFRDCGSGVRAGAFSLGALSGGDRPGVASHVGLLLPFKYCRDETVRQALEAIPAAVRSSEGLSERRVAVQQLLDQAFGGDVLLLDGHDPDEFFATQLRPGLIPQLAKSFSYVVDVLDDQNGAVELRAVEPFGWRSYGELVEWFNGVDPVFGTVNPARWKSLTPFFVSGNTGHIGLRDASRSGAQLLRPCEDLPRWFCLRPDVTDAPVGVLFEMGQYGWAKLHISLADCSASMDLSNVFDPFDDLVAWGREVDEGDLPVMIEIDEEGSTAVLAVLPTEDPKRVLLRVTRLYPDELLLEGVVARSELAATFKAELRRFFTLEFDPGHWDGDCSVNDGGDPPTLVRLKQDAWFSASMGNGFHES